MFRVLWWFEKNMDTFVTRYNAHTLSLFSITGNVSATSCCYSIYHLHLNNSSCFLSHSGRTQEAMAWCKEMQTILRQLCKCSRIRSARCLLLVQRESEQHAFGKGRTQPGIPKWRLEEGPATRISWTHLPEMAREKSWIDLFRVHL